MKEMVSSIKTVENNVGKTIEGLAARQLATQRAASVPEAALVSKFDVDQREFLTPAFKGFSMIQKGSEVGTYGTLTVQADYETPPEDRNKRVRPIPGQPTLVYPVAAQSGSANTSFIRGGNTDLKRYFPVKLLIRDSFITVTSS